MSGDLAAMPEPAKPRKPQRAPEREVMNAVRQVARLKGVTLWRNNCGQYEAAPGRWVRYGLGTGSSDLIGMRTITITADMIGKRIAQLVAVECKAPCGVLTEAQFQFIEQVRDAGGLAGVAKSAEDAEELLR